MSTSVSFPLVLSFLFLPVWSDSDHCHSICLFHGMLVYGASFTMRCLPESM